MNQADVSISGVRPEEMRLDRHPKGIETGCCSVEYDGEEEQPGIDRERRGEEEAKMPGGDGRDSGRRWQRGRTAENEMCPSQTLALSGTWSLASRRPRHVLTRPFQPIRCVSLPRTRSSSPASTPPPILVPVPPPRPRLTIALSQRTAVWCLRYVGQRMHHCRPVHMHHQCGTFPCCRPAPQVYLLLSSVPAPTCLLRRALLASPHSSLQSALRDHARVGRHGPPPLRASFAFRPLVKIRVVRHSRWTNSMHPVQARHHLSI